MANGFGKGDIVQLKSGGPPMTVDRLPGERDNDYSNTTLKAYECTWFKGASKEAGSFGEHLLHAFVPPANKEK